MKLKRQAIALLILLINTGTNAQYVTTPFISAQEKAENQQRAKLKIASYKLAKSDSTYFYTENYNKNGQVISHRDSEFSETKYDYNNFGRKIRAYQIIDDKTETVWEAYYIMDSVLYKVKWDINAEYKEDIIYDDFEREIKRYKKYRHSTFIDSIITGYSGNNSVEITYKKGRPVSKVIEKKDSSTLIEEFFKFFEPDSTVHYLTWTTSFNLMGNQTSRVQQFFDRDEKTEYLTTYTDTDHGLEKTYTVKTNGKVKFEIIQYYNKDNKLIKSIYHEPGYKTETDYFYDHLGLESITITTKKGKKPESETYFSTYEFYTDR